MACSQPNMMGFSPLDGYKFRGPRSQEVHILDRFGAISDGQSLYLQDIPCGKCDLCLIENRYSKALRIMLEAESYPDSVFFITLTYDNEHIENNELNHSHWVQFMKDFRAKFCQAKYCNIRDRGTLRHGKEYSKTFNRIKQVVAGEYGDSFGRRHFHGILFGHKFNDLVDTGRVSSKGFPVYTSPSLQSVWKKGMVQVDVVTFDLALYVAAYITDKALDEEQETPDGYKKQYGRFGKGIGLRWISKYWRDVLSVGKVMLLNRDFPVPRYFFEAIKKAHPLEFEKWKRKKVLQGLKIRDENILKGDGPLRRAKAKGRIHAHIKSKRRQDESYREAPSRALVR